MAKDRSYPEVRDAVARLCADYPDAYWRDKDRDKTYPTEFVQALTDAGYLSVLIPEEYGGAGMDLGAACAVLEEIQRSGANGAACHAQMYIMGTLLRHGSDEQKRKYLPGIASGELRLQAFGVTEPTSGTDTTRIKTRARRDGDEYIVDGQKVFISRVEHSDLLLLLVRTTPRDEADKPTRGMSVLLVDLREAVGNGLTIRPLETMLNHATTELFFDELRVPAENLIGEEGQGFGYILDGMKKTQGLSVLLVDMRDALGNGLTIRPIRTMMNHATTEVFFDDLRVPAKNLIGEEGKGFRYILSGMNAERILIAAECIGDAKWFIEKATSYAGERVLFDRPIGQNQGVQFPIARAYANMRAAELMPHKAISMYDAGETPGAEANMAKMLAADASWEAAEMCVQTHGGFGFAEEYDIERKFRETRLYQVAPISTNMILSCIAEHVLGLPRSY